MPLVAVEIPTARARTVPMTAATMPTTIVSQIGKDQSRESADDGADDDRGDDAGNGHVTLNSCRMVRAGVLPARDNGPQWSCGDRCNMNAASMRRRETDGRPRPSRS